MGLLYNYSCNPLTAQAVWSGFSEHRADIEAKEARFAECLRFRITPASPLPLPFSLLLWAS